MAGTRMTAEQRREQLLDITRAIVVAEGFRTVTVDRITSEAGVTRAVVYQHFASLDGLFTALVERETERVLATLTAVISRPVRPGLEAGLAALAAFLEATDADPDSWRMLLLPPEGGPPELYERIAAGRALGRARIRELIGADERLHTDPDPELTAYLVQALTDELLRLHVRNPRRYPTERLLSEARRLLSAISADARR